MAPGFNVVASRFTVEDDDFSTTLHHSNQGFDGVLPLMGDESLALMLQRERQLLPDASYYLKRFHSGDLDLEARNEAVAWIKKVNKHYGFGPLCSHLAVNYLDRFLSAYEMPRGKAWMMQLVAVACLSLACKMEETEVPLSLDLQLDGFQYVFEARTIKRMELLVCSTLEWRMRAITPFAFIDHFIYKINDDQSPPPRSSWLRSVQLISAITEGIDFLEFRPSEIAAAVAILVVKESQSVDIEKAVSILSQYVEKVSVLKCIELIWGVAFTGDPDAKGNSSVSSVPRSLIGILDVASLSFRSNGSTAPCASSANCSPEYKQSKLNGPREVEP